MSYLSYPRSEMSMSIPHKRLLVRPGPRVPLPLEVPAQHRAPLPPWHDARVQQADVVTARSPALVGGVGQRARLLVPLPAGGGRNPHEGHDAEEVARLGVGIRPRGVVPAALGQTPLDPVSVPQEDGVQVLVCLDSNSVEHGDVVGPVGVEGDATKPARVAFRRRARS